jgi:glycosyltransferase involved in cell wall biosynthesis
MTQPRVLILAYTVASTDPRVMRQVEALRHVAEVTVAAKSGGELPVARFIEIGVGPERTISWSFRRVVAALLLLLRTDASIGWLTGTRVRRLRQIDNESFDIVLANDVECLPAVFRYFRGASRVVLDAHEFAEDEFPERLLWRLLVRPLVRKASKAYLPRVDGMMTVSQGLASLYAERYGCHAEVVMSADALVDLDPMPPSDGMVRMVHVGRYSPFRGLDTLCVAVDLLGLGHTLDFYLVPQQGFDRFRARWSDHPRITFHDPVPMYEVSRTVNAYDIGVYALPPSSTNNARALPNKFFQFVHGRVAVAIGPSQEMAHLVRQYDCGVVAESFSAEALAAAIEPLRADDLWRMKQGSDAAARELNLERFANIIRRVVLEGVEETA